MCPQDAALDTPPDYGRLTRRQAERVAGVSRATLARYVADGRLSAGKDRNGHNVYDAAELQRVFPEHFNLKRLEAPEATEGMSPQDAGEDTGRDSAAVLSLTVEKRYLTEERDRLREEAERLRRELADERQRRDAERAEFLTTIRQGQEALKQLTDQRQAPPRGFLARLFGG